MRSSSPKFQRLSNQLQKQSSEGDVNDTALHLAPLIPDGDDGGFLSSSHPHWDQQRGVVNTGTSKLQDDGKLPLDDEKKEAIEDPLAKKVIVPGEEKKSWLDLTWAASWILMLNRELNGSFVFGVIAVYGFGQGFGGSINNVVVDYYWKDVQLAQPSAVQLYRGFSAIPWDVKPLWGLMTDILPIAGYHRRPYFLITGVLTVVATMVLVTGGKLWVPMAVGMLVLLSACTALSDATIDAEVARKSREKPSLAADIQSLCAITLAVGSLVGYAFSGLSVDKFGSEVQFWTQHHWLCVFASLEGRAVTAERLKDLVSDKSKDGIFVYIHIILCQTRKGVYCLACFLQGALSLMLVPAFLLLILGFVLHEERDSKKWHVSQLGKQLWTVIEQLWATLKQSRVWKPTLYMYLSIAVSLDISEGKFYWYTSARDGPAFSEEFVGAIYATGSIGTLAAVYLYHKKLKRVSFRWILFWVQALVAVFGMLDFMLVTRFNRKLHIPDHVFVVGDEGMTQALSRLKWMPLLILAAKLCPPGIEGTFFSFLMSVDNVGELTSSWLGAALLHVTKVSRDNFEYLWLAVMIRNMLRLVPIFLVFLLPNTDPEEDILVQKQPEENIQLVVTAPNQKESSLGM